MSSARRVFAGYAAGVLLCLGLAAATGHWWVAALPALPALVWPLLTDVRWYFWLLLIMIPLGVEVSLPGGVGTDLPTEPIAVALTGVLLLHAARHWRAYPAVDFAHPAALLLYVHLAWLFVTALASTIPLFSVKFFLSKLWYVGAFFVAPVLFLRSPRRVLTFTHCLFWPLLFVAVQTLIRHASFGFSFADQYRTMAPFMRNHVNYAACLAVCAPWVVYLFWWRRRGRRAAGRGRDWLPWLVVPVWLAAVYFSYTRAAYVALVLAAGAYFVVRWRLLRPAVVLALVAGLGATVFLIRNDKYLDYAPNFDTTIAHKQFDDLIAATYQLEDVSTMERFHRWVAGGNMVPYRPWTGFGPGTFVEQYPAYTNNNFRTWVSANPERSGIHNYYLMTLVEQGYPGLVILVLWLVVVLLYGERAYHRQRDPAARNAILAAVLSLIVIDAFQIINDLLETDKVGSLFFLNIAILIVMSNYRPPTNSTTSR